MKFHFVWWEKLILLCGIILIIGGIIGLSTGQIQKLYDIKPKGGVYTESINGRLGALDPIFSIPGTVEYEILSLVFSGLLKYDANTGKYVGDIASSFEISEDLKEYTFYIKEELKWHDGQNLNIDDVEYTYNFLKNQDIGSIWYKTFANVDFEVNKEYNSIKFKIKQTDRLFIQTFVAPILPQHLLEPISIEQIKNGFFASFPIGSGKFKLIDVSRLKKRDRVELLYFSNYYEEEKPNISLINFEFFEDISLAGTSSAFRSTTEKERYEKYSMDLPRYRTLFFNVESDVLRPTSSRRGLYYATQLMSKEINDTNPMLDVFIKEEEHDNTEDYINSHTKEESESKIKELFYNSGWQLYSKEFDDSIRRNSSREKIELRLLTLKTPELEKQAEYLKQFIEKFGVVVKIGAFNWTELYRDFIQYGKYDLLILNMETGYGNDMYKYLHSLQKNDFSYGRNFSQFANIDFDLLLEDVRLSQTEERLDKVLYELEKRYDQFIPFVHVEKETYDYYIYDNIKGVNMPKNALSPQDRFMNFNEMYFE
jgi:peptide/nickel transport system substrate-binding protein